MGDSSILVTGGAGFIGSNFVLMAVERFDEVYVIDKMTYAADRSRLSPVMDDMNFHEEDIRDEGVVKDVLDDVDYVVNFAAESHVDRSIESGKPFVRSNVEGTFTLFDQMRDADIRRAVHISTDEVYGSIQEGEFTESDCLDPSSPYSASKAAADMFVNAFWETYDLPISVIRPTNAYGPRQHEEKLIPKFIARALQGESLPIYGSGEHVRQWIFVEDLCEAIFTVLEHGNPEVYNVGGTTRKSVREVTEKILELTDASEDLIEFVDDRKGHDFRYAIDDSKLRDQLGWEPSIGFDEGLKRTVEWYKKFNCVL